MTGRYGQGTSDPADTRSTADTFHTLHTLHQKLLAAEQSAWDNQPLPLRNLARQTWRDWYRLDLRATLRLLARAGNARTADELVRELGGTDRFARRFAEVASRLGILRYAANGALQWRLPPRLTYQPADLPTLSVRPELGQLPCTPASRRRVGELVLADLPWGGKVLLLGDDDLIAPALVASGLSVTVLDLDERLGAVLDKTGGGFVRGDVRALPAALHNQFDAVLCDPADNSVALLPWLRAAAAALTDQPGSRLYLSLAPIRLGYRWAGLAADVQQLSLVPCGHSERCKEYRREGRMVATTDCWVFERVPRLSRLPLPYLDIETVR